MVTFEDERDETGVPLRALPDRFTYLYDFGDGWEHEIEVIGAGADRPGVVDGEGACPPENVGGPPGYADFLKVMADPGDPEHDRMKTWARSWNASFDMATADLLVQQTAGAVPAPVRLVLDLAADGVKLTPGGRLPRTLVRQVQQRYPNWYPLGRPASIEEDLPPLAALHDLLREVGLLRLRKGVLSPPVPPMMTPKWSDACGRGSAPGMATRCCSLPTRSRSSQTEGSCKSQDLTGRLLGVLGDRWITSQGQHLDEPRVLADLNRLRFVLVGLDLIDTSNGLWTAGPSARSLLPRATTLAHLWST